MKKKIIKNINDNLNEENTNNIFIPPTKKKNENNESETLENINLNKDNNNIFGLTKKNKNPSKSIVNKSKSKKSKEILEKLEMTNVDSQTKQKNKKNKKNKIINEIKNNNNKIYTLNIEQRKIKSITINELKDKGVPKYSKSKKRFASIYIFCIYRRKAYPFIFNVNSKIIDIFSRLSKELKIEKDYLEFRVNERIISKKEDEKLIKELIEEENTDKIYVTKVLPNYNLINNLYNKTYNNIVIIENSLEIEEIEKKLNKYLEEYHMEKDYYFNKINENKYSFGFSYPDFAFDFHRLLLILKRSENDFKDIKTYLKLDKRKSKNIFPFNQILRNSKDKNNKNN